MENDCRSSNSNSASNFLSNLCSTGPRCRGAADWSHNCDVSKLLSHKYISFSLHCFILFWLFFCTVFFFLTEKRNVFFPREMKLKIRIFCNSFSRGFYSIIWVKLNGDAASIWNIMFQLIPAAGATLAPAAGATLARSHTKKKKKAKENFLSFSPRRRWFPGTYLVLHRDLVSNHVRTEVFSKKVESFAIIQQSVPIFFPGWPGINPLNWFHED